VSDYRHAPNVWAVKRTKEVKEKSKETCLNKYGVEYTKNYKIESGDKIVGSVEE
jgi:hypothetical protein